MTIKTRLTESEILKHLDDVSDWSLTENEHGNSSIKAQYSFKNFTVAFAFMTQVAFLAEKLNHHPDWSNTFKKVTINLTTHDVDGLTELDFELARQIHKISKEYS